MKNTDPAKAPAMMPACVFLAGAVVGASVVGASVGASVEAAVGAAVGATVGGEVVGAEVGHPTLPLRSLDGCPESMNMSSKVVTEQTFQPVTSWVKSVARLCLIQGRVEMCEMRFAFACVNVRMRSEYITQNRMQQR